MDRSNFHGLLEKAKHNIRERKAKLSYTCPHCGHLRNEPTEVNQKTISVPRMFCLDCKVEMQAFLSAPNGDRIL